MKIMDIISWAFIIILGISALIGLYAVGSNIISNLGIIPNTITTSGKIGVVTVNGINIYSDPQCTQVVNSIAWGNVDPAKSYPKTFYMKNLATSSGQVSFTMGAYVPSNAANYVTFSFDKQGIWMSPNSVTKLIITMNVAANSGTSGVTDWSTVITISLNTV
jgi:hypothetical protein